MHENTADKTLNDTHKHQRHGTAVRHAKETMLDRPHAFFTATPVGSAADKARELRRSLIQCCRPSIVECVTDRD